MLNILTKLILVCSLALNVYANVTSVVPQKDATNVPADITIQITFNNPIVFSSLKKNTIKLKKDNKKIKGELSVKDTNTLVFTPNENLKTGTYSLHVKSIKLKNPEPIKPKTWFQKIIYKICSFFYSDVRKCKLYSLFFGNNDIKTKSINYSFSVNDNIATIETLNLETSLIELKENTQANLTLKATYTDGVIKDITENIVWSIQDNSIVTINNNTLEALKEGITTLSSKVDNTTSNAITIIVYKEINGYKLPPEPDETINNSTLLGIDSNNNGVRDDVERWIYETYDEYIPCHQVPDGEETLSSGEIVQFAKEICEENPIPYHPVVRAVAMQGARAAQIIIQEPEKARETTKIMDAAQECGSYFGVEAYSENEAVYMGKDFFGKAFDAMQFNTIMRARAYGKYNFALSGGVFDASSSSSDMRNACDFNVDNILSNK